VRRPLKSEQFARIRFIPTFPTSSIPCIPSPSASALSNLAIRFRSDALALTTATSTTSIDVHLYHILIRRSVPLIFFRKMEKLLKAVGMKSFLKEYYSNISMTTAPSGGIFIG
jgi:hypothetical protein